MQSLKNKYSLGVAIFYDNEKHGLHLMNNFQKQIKSLLFDKENPSTAFAVNNNVILLSIFREFYL